MNQLRRFLLSLFAISAIFFVFNDVVSAETKIVSSSLNGKSQNITFNPNNGEVSIEVRANVPVKFTRLYICATTQVCSGSKGNYTRYFTSSEISESINKVWNGRVSSDSKSDFALAGEYKIMVSMVEGSSPAITEFVPYTVTVSFSEIGDVALPAGDPDADSGGDSGDTGGSEDDDGSTHYEQESLSNYTESVSAFKVSAGRERVTYVGSPVSFESKYKDSVEVKSKKIDCTWSFGDGSSSREEDVIHVYKYPGEYNVVLNAKLEEVDSIARTKVKVLTPSLLLSIKPDGATEVLNKGTDEINLYRWKIQSGNQAYAFPLDTIISAGKSVTFPAEYLKISTAGNEIILLDASNGVVARAGAIGAGPLGSQNISTADFEKFASEYRRLTSGQPATLATISKTASAASAFTKATSSDFTKDYPSQIDTAMSDLAVSEEASSGFWSKVFHPLRTIRETFYK